MLRGVLISASREQRFAVHSWAESTRGVMLLTGFEDFPDADTWRRFQHAHAPQVVFLDLDTDFERALELAQSLKTYLCSGPVQSARAATNHYGDESRRPRSAVSAFR